MTRPVRSVLMLMVALVLFTMPLSAEMAPEVYEQMKSSAPEQLEVRVRSVQVRAYLLTRARDVTVKAEILAVTRSETMLSDGDGITIRYESYNPPKRGWAGPRPIPIVKKGEETVAFLQWDAALRCYVPAARGASFEPLQTYWVQR